MMGRKDKALKNEQNNFSQKSPDFLKPCCTQQKLVIFQRF